MDDHPPSGPRPTAGGGPALSRRRLLELASGATLAASAGCVRRVRSLLERDRPEQVSLRIKTMPADADPRAIRVARYLADKLQTAGIATNITPLAREAFYRDVLLNQDFDLYVAPYPAEGDPDFLRELCHSRFGAEPGWQNPFGYANLDVDALLEAQRRQSGTRRRSTLGEIQRSVVRSQPFSVVAFPDAIRATRDDAFAGWTTGAVHSLRGYLTVDRRSPDADTLRMTIDDARPTENRNPIAVEFRDGGTVTDLLYDQLGRRLDGTVRPWLAAGWQWSAPPTAPGPAVEVALRPDVTWHDGEALTAEDVAFTYRFLNDTALGELESPVPSPRFRGPASLVESAEVVDERTVRLTFVAASREVARQAFTVPVLPAHVWQDKTSPATVAGVDTGGAVTEALVWPNRKPVGSGPLEFEAARVKESLTLSRNDDHFLADARPLPVHLATFRGGFAPERLRFLVVPSGGTGVELVASGDAHATASGVTPEEVRRIGQSEAMELHVSQPRSFYHVGFNLRRAPLSSPRFRRGVARLLDKPFIVEEAFGGYAQPAASPLARHEALAPNLAWTGQDPELPFPGENGTLDVDQAREPFVRAGYRYSESGELLMP